MIGFHFVRTVCLLALAMGVGMAANAQNYIHYHQQSLRVQEYMALRDTTAALTLLAKLEKKYGLMPTETYARALCELATGDTATARRSFLGCFRQRAPIGWMFTDPPFKNIEMLHWYRDLTDECLALWQAQTVYVDGPNEGVPTVATRANNRFQFILDSMVMVADKRPMSTQDSMGLVQAYAEVVQLQTLTLDSILTGKLPFPYIQALGFNGEFETLVIHADSGYTYNHRKVFQRWLKKGLIYPRVYVICFDRRHQLRGGPLPYGIFNCMKTEDLVPGYEKRRAAIGMGDDRLDGARFHWLLDCGD